MDKEELLLRYECEGGEDLYAEAKPKFEEALAASPGDARLLNAYGYLLECHGRRMIRAAAGYYQQAIDVDPDWAKPRFQQIGALSALQDASEVIPRYEARLAESPGDAIAYQLLALAYRYDHDHAGAARIIAAGLERFPGDPGLIEQQGDLYAATGRPEDALAWWRRAARAAPDDYGISMHYSAAFLLERLGRLAGAADEWRFIVGWCEEHDALIEAQWPRYELQRIEAALGAH
jgi:tetratricopeptide (TPR) repeat protein